VVKLNRGLYMAVLASPGSLLYAGVMAYMTFTGNWDPALLVLFPVAWASGVTFALQHRRHFHAAAGCPRCGEILRVTSADQIGPTVALHVERDCPERGSYRG